MTLEQVMRMYEAEMEKVRRNPSTPRQRVNQLQMSLADDELVYDITENFSLMFWRLYPNGDLSSGIDFDRVFAEKVEEYHDAQQTTFLPAKHKHNYLEISYVYRGSLTQNINGTDHTFNQGDVWIMDRNCLHEEYRYGRDCFVVFVEAYAEFFDELFAQAFKNNPAGTFIKEALLEKRSENRFIHFRANGPDPDVERIFNYVLEERDLNRPGSEFVLKGLFISLFALLGTNYNFQITEKKQQYLNEKLYKDIERYLMEHYTDVTLEQLAKVFSFNKNYLGRLIQQNSGLGYKDLLQKIRLKQAGKLLSETDRPVNEIAAAVGYQNISYFFRLFKAHYNMTPNQYRGTFSL